MAFLSKLLLVILVLLAFRWIMRILRLSTAHSGDSGSGDNRSNVHVDHNPNQSKKDYDGGEYIDYEEVK